MAAGSCPPDRHVHPTAASDGQGNDSHAMPFPSPERIIKPVGIRFRASVTEEEQLRLALPREVRTVAVLRGGGRSRHEQPEGRAAEGEHCAKPPHKARPWLTVYLGGMGAKGKNFYVDAAERFGQGDAAREVQRLFMAGDRAGAAPR